MPVRLHSSRPTLTNPGYRQLLAKSDSVINHRDSKADKALPRSILLKQQCTHYFVDPLQWMQDELYEQKVEGTLQCPKCKSKVGSYAWQGMKCSCGYWQLPGISIAKSKVDRTDW